MVRAPVVVAGRPRDQCPSLAVVWTPPRPGAAANRATPRGSAERTVQTLAGR